MILPPDLQFQSDVAARLAADDFLRPFGVSLESEGVTENDIAQALGPVRAGGVAGKRAGTLLTVLITEDGRDEKVNIPGPQEEFSLTVRVLELPKVARMAAQAAGVPYVPYSAVVQRVKQLCHQCQLGTALVLYLKATPYNDGQGTVGKDVLFTWKPAPVFAVPAARPVFTAQPDGSLALSSNTPSAVLYWTLDGSYPGPGNAAATQGAAIAPPAAGTLVRATAYPPPGSGITPSGVSELTA